ncbi:DUF3397 family protein [Lactobacillus sp. R2/2]|nr:DUF3397 family protein [Lactobacillus sp. R2/2]
MFSILIIPLVGLALAFIINKMFPRAQFRGYDLLPIFFIYGCHLINLNSSKRPEFLPYGFFVFFILVILLAVSDAVKNKNLSISKTMRKIWNYLTVNTIFWYLGLLFMMI